MSRFWLNETICHLIWIIWISKWDSEIIFVQSIEALKMNIELTLFRDYSMEDLTFRMDVEVYMKCFTDKTLWFIELKRADYEAWGWVWACQRLSALLHWLQHCIKKWIWKPTSKVISKLNFCFSFTLNERVHTHTLVGTVKKGIDSHKYKAHGYFWSESGCLSYFIYFVERFSQLVCMTFFFSSVLMIVSTNEFVRIWVAFLLYFSLTCSVSLSLS